MDLEPLKKILDHEPVSSRGKRLETHNCCTVCDHRAIEEHEQQMVNDHFTDKSTGECANVHSAGD